MDYQSVSEESTSPLEEAKQRLCKAALSQPMTPTTAAVSAYATSVLTAARVDALVDFQLNPPLNGSWTIQEAWDAALVRAINNSAQKLEDAVKEMNRIQIASADSPLARTN